MVLWVCITWDHNNSEGGAALIWQGYKFTLNSALSCGEKCRDLAWWKNYKEDTAIRHFIQKSAAIAFVPLNFVQVSWNGLKTEMPDDEKLERYYFDKTWFDGHFRPMSWLMETGTLTHTFQQLDTKLFPLILAIMFSLLWSLLIYLQCYIYLSDTHLAPH